MMGTVNKLVRNCTHSDAKQRGQSISSASDMWYNASPKLDTTFVLLPLEYARPLGIVYVAENLPRSRTVPLIWFGKGEYLAVPVDGGINKMESLTVVNSIGTRTVARFGRNQRASEKDRDGRYSRLTARSTCT